MKAKTKRNLHITLDLLGVLIFSVDAILTDIVWIKMVSIFMIGLNLYGLYIDVNKSWEDK